LKTRDEKRLIWAMVVTCIVLAGEAAGGLIANSLALLSDAGHVLTDVFALGLSLIAASISKRASDHRATYGYQRFGVLAALINGLSLVVISGLIFIETYRRILSPPEVNSNVMLLVAGAGLAGNIVMARILGGSHKDLNIKSAWLHVLGDLVTTAGVIAAGILIKLTGWRLADPVASVVVGIIIILGGARVIKESLWVFLELSPLGFHPEDISKMICSMDDVRGVHDVHVWSIGHGVPAFSAHVLLNDRKISETDVVRKEIEEKLSNLGIRHTVLQMECAECLEDALYCQIPGTLEEEEEHLHHRH
jgi:cobalt-zinc-cadmium efflux system protein